jgi:hypothetical protein
VLLVSGPIGDPDSHPSAVRRRAVQASKVMIVSLKFLRDILSTSSKVRRQATGSKATRVPWGQWMTTPMLPGGLPGDVT